MKTGDIYQYRKTGCLVRVGEVTDERVEFRRIQLWKSKQPKQSRMHKNFNRDFQAIDMTLYRSETITVLEPQYSQSDDAVHKFAVDFCCPACQKYVFYASNKTGNKCACGRTWNVELKATGVYPSE